MNKFVHSINNNLHKSTIGTRLFVSIQFFQTYVSISISFMKEFEKFHLIFSSEYHCSVNLPQCREIRLNHNLPWPQHVAD
jgi:hypothetical protein